MALYRALGMMSGTSMDGIDVALVETDGEAMVRFGPSVLHPYPDEVAALLRQAVTSAADLNHRASRPGPIAEAETIVTRLHVAAIEMFLNANGHDSIDVIGFHGQTVLHRPERRLTVQIGDGAALAAETKIPVVYDFRAADVTAGGQGAPLVPIYHRALVMTAQAGAAKIAGPVAVLNLGGVANITYIDGETLIACDTGPANALIDDFMRERTGESVDLNGATAARGSVDDGVLTAALDDPFFTLPPPKSLDRNHPWRLDVSHLGIEDGAATLTAFTAASVAKVVEHLRRAPQTWVVAGGGARNRTLMAMLQKRLNGRQVVPASALGWSIDALEAQAFAYLAVRSLRGLPITFPTTTGAPRPLTGGVLARPNQGGLVRSGRPALGRDKGVRPR